MTKVLLVNACRECWHLRVSWRTLEGFCSLDEQRRKVEEDQTLPGWCPLPDLEEKEAEG